MKTTFKLLSMLCFLAIGLTNCSVVDVIENNSINIRFKNVTNQNFEDFTFDGESLGTLNQGEMTEYVNINFGSDTFKETALFTAIENVVYSQNLSLMMTEPDMGYCGVGLEDKLMMEKGGEFTIEIYIDKTNPKTLKTDVIW